MTGWEIVTFAAVIVIPLCVLAGWVAWLDYTEISDPWDCEVDEPVEETKPDSIDYDYDGKVVDEIVIRGADMVHMELLDSDLYYLAIYRGPKRLMFNLHGPITIQDNDLVTP